MDDKVLFYEGRWYMFSNFSSFAILWNGKLWMTAEHAYQAAKFSDKAVIQEIYCARSAHEAKKIARKYADLVRSDWNQVMLSVMEEVVRAKVSQHPYVQKKLLETGEAEIVEDSPKDSFWGRGPDWKGGNNLGKIWMKLRKELRAEK